MDKIEINVRGAEYSAYFETESGFKKEKNSRCPKCGAATKFSPVVSVKLEELWNADKMTPVSLTSPRAREVAKKIKVELNQFRKICDACLDTQST